MQCGVDAGADHREKRHRFGGAVDRGAPLLAGQEKNRRNERARVTDADPEHEVCNIPGPADGVVVSPNADASRDEVTQEGQAHERERHADSHRDIPPGRRLALDDRADVIADPAHRALVEHERLADELFFVFRKVLGMFGCGVGHFLNLSGRLERRGRRRGAVGRCGNHGRRGLRHARRGGRLRWPFRLDPHRASWDWGCGCGRDTELAARH